MKQRILKLIIYPTMYLLAFLGLLIAWAIMVTIVIPIVCYILFGNAWIICDVIGEPCCEMLSSVERGDLLKNQRNYG